jgi:hypothetical protein
MEALKASLAKGGGSSGAERKPARHAPKQEAVEKAEKPAKRRARA